MAHECTSNITHHHHHQQQQKFYFRIVLGITYFDKKLFPVFFNYFMEQKIKPQNSTHFKNQLIEIYKIMRFLRIKKIELLYFKKYRNSTTFFKNYDLLKLEEN